MSHHSESDVEQCPDCGVALPALGDAAPSHRYIGASPSCWALYSSLLAGEPPLAPAPLNALLVDAYAAQHHGTPSPQAIRSVAIHLLLLYGVLVQGVAPEHALWIRRRPSRPLPGPERERFHWLTPPDFTGCVTVADIAQAPSPEARTLQARSYIEQVWTRWAQLHRETVAEWYDRYVR